MIEIKPKPNQSVQDAIAEFFANATITITRGCHAEARTETTCTGELTVKEREEIE